MDNLRGGKFFLKKRGKKKRKAGKKKRTLGGPASGKNIKKTRKKKVQRTVRVKGLPPVQEKRGKAALNREAGKAQKKKN